jgi:hypothetical protein
VNDEEVNGRAAGAVPEACRDEALDRSCKSERSSAAPRCALGQTQRTHYGVDEQPAEPVEADWLLRAILLSRAREGAVTSPEMPDERREPIEVSRLGERLEGELRRLQRRLAELDQETLRAQD